ncbi:MAG: competence protein [Bacteroidetes bacterium CG23_combo_of_CG06-09_8_20_14_all_32_9]|nr:MAG: competence protein [Bacteroidetes bacterium CG23_combo_of_CG06-09_8_20_14_all_32_9]
MKKITILSPLQKVKYSHRFTDLIIFLSVIISAICGNFFLVISDKRIFKVGLIIILSVFISYVSFAVTTNAALDSANAAYKRGDFEKAAKVYETVLSAGLESASLYYNIGNAYFRLRNIPKSILYYERAKLKAPDDEDINFNLNLASGYIVDKINSIPEFFVYTWIKSITNIFSVNQWSYVSLLLFILSLILILAFLFSGKVILRKLFFWLGVLILILSIISTVIAIKSSSAIVNNKSAIVMQAVTTAKSSPDDNSTDLFIIHEGTKVTINEELDDWCEIKLSDGNVGWIKTKDIQKI